MLENENKSGDKPARLEVENLFLRFGRISVLNQITFKVNDNEILAIIGPNGAGKTSIINCINGFYKPASGTVSFEGKYITNLKPDRIAKFGIGRTFQNIQLYTGLTVLDNIMGGRHPLMRSGFFSNILFYGRTLREEIKERQVVEEIIDFLNLQKVRKQVVGTLPYGTRKIVELGRALALEPKMLILDEPMAGMNVEEKEDMARFIIDIFEGQRRGYNSKILRRGIKSVIFIEHDMGVVMDIADRILALDFGTKIAEGTPEEIKVNPRVISAYLGQEVL